MAYNKEIDTRIRAVVSQSPGTEAKRRFGGVYKGYLILRPGETQAAEALKLPHTRPFGTTGKPMRAWVMVATDGFPGDGDLPNGWTRPGNL